MKAEQIERMNKINELIEVIANTDRCFFNHNKISKFEFGKTKLFLIDGYTLKRVYPYPRWGDPSHFCEGGTLWGLVNDFREWIITGKYSNGKNGYGGLYCPHWGYSEEGMSKIVMKGKEIGFIREDALEYKEVLKKYKERGLA